jgi:hypothetical protein
MRTGRRTVLAVVAGLVLACGACTTSPQASPAKPAPPMIDRDVLAPGEGGSVPAGLDSTSQIPLYDGLTPLGGNVTAADLDKYFKDDPLGDTTGRHEYVPISGLTIIRDQYDVPHIYGKTRADVEFGAGWVAAEDRGFLLQFIRSAGALAALDAPGIDAFAVASSGQQFEESAATKNFLSSELSLASTLGPQGRQILTDATNYVRGIDAYFAYSKDGFTPWTVDDVVAATALIGAVFGRGGGNQVADSSILADIEQRLGATEGMQVSNDLRQAQDADTPTTISQRYVYEPLPTGPTPGSAVVDAGSVQDVSALTPRRHMSNALLVGPGRTFNGSSVAVIGPQVGYYYPELLLEMDIHGGGLDARGAAFPGTSLYVELGRGPNYAWSATSSGSENVDQFLEQLCNPDGSKPTRQSDHYLYDGRCIPMTTLDAGYLEPGIGSPGGEVVIHETVNGPVSGTCTVGGVLYAIATKRSTYGRDVVSALGFEELNDGTVTSPQSFISAASNIEFTFNWFYVDASHIAFFSSGRLPIRAPGTNPTLPTFGNGSYEWRGFLSPSAHPQAIDPAGEELVNWNNIPAPGWGAASDNWDEGPVDHVLLLTDGIKGDSVTPQALVSAMNDAATEDPEGALVWPVIAKVLATGPAPSVQAAAAAQIVSSWVKGGSSVLAGGPDSANLAGEAIIQTAWPALEAADLSPVLGPLWSEIPADGMSYLVEDLSDLLGLKQAAHYSRVYCGNGNLARCRTSLWAAIQSAVQTLTSEHGSVMAAWRQQPAAITFLPGLLPTTIRYTNRPTFQQVVWFGS